MELRLEIKLASVEELSTVASALAGLQVEDIPTKNSAPSKKIRSTVTHELDSQTEEEYEEVESPFTATPSEPDVKQPPKETKANKKQAAAEAKAAKKAQEEAERQERIARLKAQMEADQKVADQALAKSAEIRDTRPGDTQLKEESPEAIANEIKALGDQLMAFNGIPLEAKQALTSQVMAQVGVPQGVRPTMLQQPMLGQFRDAYRLAVNSIINPVMGGLV